MKAYNFIAPFYDSIAYFIYGKKLENASRLLIQEIEENQSILILGGGTGKILQNIPASCQVEYLDSSESMIEKAKKRLYNCSVEFVCQDFLRYTSDKKFDIIICPFFLDNFTKEELEKVYNKILTLSNITSQLFVADFDIRSKNKWNKILMKGMLLFFYLIRATKSLEFNKVFEFLEKQEKLDQFSKLTQKNGFIVSCKYTITSPT